MEVLKCLFQMMQSLDLDVVVEFKDEMILY